MADDKKKSDASGQKGGMQAPTNTPSGMSSAKVMEAIAAAGPETFGAENCCVREFWAVVERDGTLIRGRNVWRVARLAAGIYEVVFTGDVSNGVYNATIGRPGIATEPHGFVTVALRCCLGSPETNKGVWVDFRDANGNFSDRAFHLSVLTQ
ncbi:MAG: hypothetical protein QOH25_2903 [Acidobacteriota bacterium]|jgi:hypothetical protein|nr:hypothetical protein [Acidobacteriota bacterium]